MDGGAGTSLVGLRRNPGATQSPARPESDAAMRASSQHHEGNPILTWCIGNMVGEADRRGNLYPNKSRPDLRIDVAVALILAMGRAVVGDKQAKGLNELPLNGQRRSYGLRTALEGVSYPLPGVSHDRTAIGAKDHGDWLRDSLDPRSLGRVHPRSRWPNVVDWAAGNRWVGRRKWVRQVHSFQRDRRPHRADQRQCARPWHRTCGRRCQGPARYSRPHPDGLSGSRHFAQSENDCWRGDWRTSAGAQTGRSPTCARRRASGGGGPSARARDPLPSSV